MAYYYLVASLPMLAIEQAPSVSSVAFLESCEGVLAPSDLADLQLVIDGRAEESSHLFLRNWTARERQLRNAIARVRAAAHRVDADAFIRPTDGFDVTTAQVASEATALTDPLARERLLDGHRWRTIDDMVGPSSFDVDAVFGFALKLCIAERWEAMSEEAGRAKLEESLEALSRTA